MLEMNPQNRITFDYNLSGTEIFITSKFGRENSQTKCHVKQQKLKLEEVILRSFKSTFVLGKLQSWLLPHILVCPNFLPIFFVVGERYCLRIFCCPGFGEPQYQQQKIKNSGPIVGPLSIQTYIARVINRGIFCILPLKISSKTIPSCAILRQALQYSCRTYGSIMGLKKVFFVVEG